MKQFQRPYYALRYTETQSSDPFFAKLCYNHNNKLYRSIKSQVKVVGHFALKAS